MRQIRIQSEMSPFRKPPTQIKSEFRPNIGAHTPLYPPARYKHRPV